VPLHEKSWLSTITAEDTTNYRLSFPSYFCETCFREIGWMDIENCIIYLIFINRSHNHSLLLEIQNNNILN